MSTSTPTTTTSLLEAVNLILGEVGLASVSSLATNDKDAAVNKAVEAINQSSVEVQSKGWHFNTEEDYPLEPDSNGFVYLPNNTAAFGLGPKSQCEDITSRGSRLYDRKSHTYVIGKTVYANIKLILPYEDIPQPIRWYITALAGRRFGVGRVPDSTTFRFTQELVQDAERAALDFNKEQEDKNLPGLSPHFAFQRRR